MAPIEKYNDGAPVERHQTGDLNLTAADLAADSVTSSEIATDAVDSAEIKSGAVGSDEIATDAVGSAEIAAGAVGSSEIDTDAVGSAEIATDAVDSAEIKADAVNSSEIATGAVGADEIATGAVGSDEIAENAVGSSELASAVVPAFIYIPCKAPDNIEMIGIGYAPAAMTVSSVGIRVGTLPGTGNTFSWNVSSGGTDLFTAPEVFAHNPNPTGFLVTLDNEATFTSYLTEVTGLGQATLNALDVVGNGDAVFIGFGSPFQAAILTMTANVNANASVMAGHYWNGSAYAALTLTDGTANAGATLAQNGTVSWLMPNNWAMSTLNGGTKYWVRLTVSATLSAAVEVDTCTVVRDAGITYWAAPNTAAVGAGDVKVSVTEADATADDLMVILRGTWDF